MKVQEVTFCSLPMLISAWRISYPTRARRYSTTKLYWSGGSYSGFFETSSRKTAEPSRARKNYSKSDPNSPNENI